MFLVTELKGNNATPVVCDIVSLDVFGLSYENLVGIFYLLIDVYVMSLKSVSRYVRISYKNRRARMHLARNIYFYIVM